MRSTTLSLTLVATLVSPLAWSVINQGIDLTDRYIVVLKNDVSPSKAEEVLAAIENQRGAVLFRYQNAIQGFAVHMPQTALKGLQHRFPDIDYIEPDMLVQAMPRGGKPSNGGDTGSSAEPPQVTPWGVSFVGGPRTPNSGNKAWIIDTGIDASHPDLNVDASLGINYARGKPNQTSDGNGHGTHVAGTIGAIDNQIDVVGIAAGVTVVPVRVLDNSGSGSMSGVIAGVDFIGQQWTDDNAHAGDCVNMSLGGSGTSQALDSAINDVASKGIIFSIAAGNSGTDISNYTPAQVQRPNVYTIAAIDSSSIPPYWSNYNTSVSSYTVGGVTIPTYVEYAMPGVNIVSTQLGGGVTSKSGTSMAAPHFCGMVLAGYAPDKANQMITIGDKEYGISGEQQ
ncbi:S8 family serine peptidase [Vibrio fluvialis]|uniref:S8 family serine peptidase n=1 Tax=Vibrio fluvialis TaxID=676 RepID=UPI001121248C|nr:S8 family serine peptidase [Vibrio fluvialis]EKO3406550.1 S8 family serine peptidase [Vibrio fluvialis]EKO3929746.1 S8 family serine peptidase [Vibrio fluvialis]ELP2652294.1 S8 family serine peptidase [Vibrio fluvialis]MBY8032622.1 S8 family serine peptidase [Vibrio fluvialis]MBY8191032.1 S8 family serine peptidase [Vibrio fluvialis]